MGKWLKLVVVGAGFASFACGSGQGQGQADLGTGATEEVVGVQTQQLGTIPSNASCLSTTLTSPAVLHVATTGNDSNAGTLALPLATLAGAQAKIPTNYTQDYQIIVHGGEYRGQRVEWTKTSATHRIRIEAAADETPIFDGRDVGSSALGRLPTFFWLSPSNATSPVAANLVIKGLTVRNYVQTGFSLGTTPPEGKAAGVGQTCTTLVDNTVREVGSLYGDCVTPSSGANAGILVINRPVCVSGVGDGWGCSCIGYGAIDLQHSGKNSFKDNKIINAENIPANVGLIHAFYVAYKSSNNLIENNYVRHISGNPFKFRDLASNNTVINNYAERAGTSAFFIDQPDGSQGEVASSNISLSNNLVTFSYDGGTISLTSPSTSFVPDANQNTDRWYQGHTWTAAQEVPTASVSADVDGDGKEEVFVAFSYPGFGFTKVVYSAGGSTELSEVAYTSSIWDVTALAAGKFGNSTTANVVAAFWDRGTHTQVQRGVVDTDATYRFGAGTLLDSTGASFWKVGAMAGGQVAGTTAPKLFITASHSGFQEVHRGDGVTLPSGGLSPGVTDGTALYSSSSWEIPALAVGKVDASGVVKLVTAFHFIGSGSPLNRLYLGSGSGSGGVTDGGSFFSDGAATLIRSLTIGTFDGTNSRLAWGASVSGVGKVFLSGLSGSTITPQATQLFSSSSWDIATVARSETRAGSGDELVTAFHSSTADEVLSADGTTTSSGATNYDDYYDWP